MTRHLSEQSVEREVGQLGYRSDQLERRLVPLPLGHFHVKLARETKTPPPAEWGRIFVLEISPDLDGYILSFARAYVTTVGAADAEFMYHNETQAVDLLTTGITIDAGELSSRTSGSPVVIDPTVPVADGDQIRVEIIADGTGALGHAVMLHFSPVGSS